jgi:eukaryotic-like serine/threonine-protein kinase
MSDAARPVPERLGKYQVRREVGRGGMGIVYEGYDSVIDRRVALKTFISQFFDGTQADNLLTRLQREAQAAGRLSHRNIIAVYDFGEDVVKDASGNDAKTAFIAMEFVEGRSLESFFEAHERFSMRDIGRIMSELLDALDYSHTHGVVHRDIKPANIILLKDGTVKVADFGVARIESSTLTQAGTVLGSPSYMSPEQFMAQTVDGRSDLYSAGVVLYQLLTAEVPFTGAFTAIMHRVLNDTPPPPTALNVQVPKGFDAVLRKAMAKRPDERYQSAAEFKQAVADAAAGTLIADSPPSGAAGATLMRPAAGAPAQSRGMRPAVLFGLLAVLVAGVAAGYYYLWPRVGQVADSRGATGTSSANSQSAGQQASTQTAGSGEPANGDATVISAVGIAPPPSAGQAQDPAATQRAVWEDARRQLVAKAAALYVQPSSLNANYSIVQAKLLTRSDDFIGTVVNQQPTQTTKDGAVYGVLKASVKVRDVQKSLNQISHDERVEFIRNNGDPRISVSVRTYGPEADSASPAQQPSTAAENVLKEHIRSFGFAVVDDEHAKPPADFHVDGEVRFKKLSAKLPASGLTIEKFVLTSWTVKAIDIKTGEEIYHNTTIPDKQSWASEELAMQDVGRLIGAQFSQSFFLQYFDFKPKQAQLRFSGLPPQAANSLLAEVDGNLIVLNASLAPSAGSDVVIDAEVSAGSSGLPTLIQQQLLTSLNKKMGQNCFTLQDGDVASELHVDFAAGCTADLARLNDAPPEALASTRTATSL